MTAGPRLAAFALVLVGTFGTAYAVGEKLPNHSHTTATADDGHDDHSGGSADIGPTGTADDGHAHSHEPSNLAPPATSARGYQLVASADATGDTAVAFRLRDPDGQPVTSFTEAHGALLHAVLIRPDLSGFQHVHPAIAADGTFEVEPGGPGAWRLIFESQPASTDSPIVLATNIDDETAVTDVVLPAPADAIILDVQGDAIAIQRSGTNFTIDAPAPLEPYLGQSAHLIAIRKDDLAYTHLHPGDSLAGMLTFPGSLSEPGTYRLFLQFGYRGEVVTAAFTVKVP